MPPIPPIPPRFPNASAFGKALGWGSKLSPEASRANAREVTREALGDTGATRSMLQGWRDVYRYLATHDPGNPSAPGRAAFLDELLSRFFPSPTGAIVPGAAAGAPAGLEPHPPGGGSASSADGGSSVSVTSPLLNSLHDWSWLGGFSSGPGASSTSSAACGPGVAACVRRSIDSSSSGGSSAYNPETNSTTILRFGF
jgi:hypothetical protein